MKGGTMFVHVIDKVEVTLRDGVPASLDWRGEHWEVSDTPTALTEVVYMTHPMSRRVGWRFQANSGGESRVFDVTDEPAGWTLAAVYD